MTTYVEARDAIVTQTELWKLVFPSYPIFYDNTTEVDMDKAGECFLQVEIDFQDSVQSDLDLGNIGTTSTGEIVFNIFYKKNSGTRATLQRLQTLINLFELKNLSGVITEVPRFGQKRKLGNWVSQELLVPFEFWKKEVA